MSGPQDTHGRAGWANRRRGEVSARLDGTPRILCLTLGALAELETAFGVDNLGDLAERFASGRLSARDVIAVIGAGLRGGGNLFDDEEVAGMSVEGGAAGAARLVVDLLAAAFPANAGDDVTADMGGVSARDFSGPDGTMAQAPGKTTGPTGSRGRP